MTCFVTPINDSAFPANCICFTYIAYRIWKTP